MTRPSPLALGVIGIALASAAVSGTTNMATALAVSTPLPHVGFGVDSTSDAPDAIPGDRLCATSNGSCTLRAAVMEANALNRTVATITIPAGTYVLTLAGANEDQAGTGDIDLLANISIFGKQGSTTIKAGSGFRDRIFDVPSGHSPRIILNGLRIVGGAPPAGQDGGGIRDLAASSMLLEYVTLSGNTADGGSGGGMYANAASNDNLTVIVSDFDNNVASMNGGGLDVEGAITAVLRHDTMRDNRAGNGGGMSAFLEPGSTGSSPDLEFVTAFGNSTTPGGAGGGLAVSRSFMSKLTVTGNSAATGGGFELVGGSVTSTITGRSAISNNRATIEGGGIHATNCGASCGSLVDITVEDNTATLDGSGLSVVDGLTLSGVTLDGNRTLGGGANGGAIFHRGSASNPLIATNVTITGNSGGPLSAGLVLASAATDVFTSATIASNSGGLANAVAVTGLGATPTFENSIISGTGLNCLGALLSLGHNIDSGNSCGLHAPGDLRNADPRLRPLLDNGGPTWTMEPKRDSPAIDAGGGCGMVDQRVVTRPQDGDGNGTALCDIGALERSDWYRNSEISITNTAQRDGSQARTTVTYTMTLTNNGMWGSIDTVVVDRLPDSVRFVSCSATGGGVCGGSGNDRTVTFSSIALGATKTITIVAGVVQLRSTRIDNTATVSSDNPDTLSFDNSSTATVQT